MTSGVLHSPNGPPLASLIVHEAVVAAAIAQGALHGPTRRGELVTTMYN